MGIKIKANKTKNEFSDTDLDELEAELRSELGENVGEEDADLDEMNKRQLLKYAKDNDITVKAPGKKDEDEIREIIQAALDDEGGSDDLDDLEQALEDGDENGGDSGEEGDELEDMSKSELLEYIADNDLDIPKAKAMPRKKLLKAIEAALEDLEGGEEDGSEEDGGELEIDPDDMSKPELLKFIKDNELEDDIGMSLKKAKALPLGKLRKLIAEAFGDEDSGDEDSGDEDSGDEDAEVSIEDMDKSDIIEYLNENMDDLGLNKAKIKKLKSLPLSKLKKQVISLVEEVSDSGDEDSGDSGEDEMDLDEMSKPDIIEYLTENMEEIGLNKAKIKKLKALPLSKLKKYVFTLIESSEGDSDNGDNEFSDMGKKDLYAVIKKNKLGIELKDARKMKVADLREAVAEEMGGGGSSKSSSKSSKSGYLSSKEAKILSKKIETITTHAEALSEILEDGAVTKKGVFSKLQKKIKAIAELASDMDDAIDEVDA